MTRLAALLALAVALHATGDLGARVAASLAQMETVK